MPAVCTYKVSQTKAYSMIVFLSTTGYYSIICTQKVSKAEATFCENLYNSLYNLYIVYFLTTVYFIINITHKVKKTDSIDFTKLI